MEQESKRGRRAASEEKRRNSRETFDRSRRVPMGGPDLKLEVHDKDHGYVYRWMNDSKNRLHKAEMAGYEFVEDSSHIGTGAEDRNSDDGSYVSQIVGTKEDGSPLRSYLMRQKREWYEEDQAAKQKPIDKIEEQLMSGAVQENPNLGQEASYVPREGIKRRVSLGRE